MVNAAHMSEPERMRTDMWRWYCRICGSSGEHPYRVGRDELARQHLNDTACGTGRHQCQDDTGQLLHVWTWGR